MWCKGRSFTGLQAACRVAQTKALIPDYPGDGYKACWTIESLQKSERPEKASGSNGPRGSAIISTPGSCIDSSAGAIIFQSDDY